jgi:DNA-binding response OmpR family regulator
MQPALSDRVRFGSFELDLRAGELRGNGDAVVLTEQQFRVVRMLVENAGEIITREEIKQKLWPNDTIVEFDHSINAAIKKLRQTLGDSAEAPSARGPALRRFAASNRVAVVCAAGTPKRQKKETAVGGQRQQSR